MIKFFRNIRKNLLSQGKTGKYVKYAIGEIILVVIGILIALQINNLNEQRKQHNQEQDYLSALKREFENNLIEVDRAIKLNASLLKNALELSTYTGPDTPNITEEKFAKLYFGTVNAEVQYRPGSGVTNEIINSGKLNIFQKKSENIDFFKNIDFFLKNKVFFATDFLLDVTWSLITESCWRG